jgi:hypothetical protein
MQQAVATRQAKLDENLARLDQARATAESLKYISNSEDERYIKGTVLPGMERISETYGMQDLSDPTVYNAMRADIRTSFDRSRVRDIQESKMAYDANQKIIADLKRRGQYHEALDLADPQRLQGGYDSRTGVYGYQTEAMLDVRKAAEQYFNNLKADTSFDETMGTITSEISKGKVQRSAQENIRSFLDSKEGEQAVRMAAYREGVDYDSIPKDQREAYAMDVLMEVGEEFQYSRTTPMPGYASMMGDRTATGIPEIAPEINLPATPQPEGLRDFKEGAKAIDRMETELKDLELNREIASRNGATEAVASIDAQIAQKEADMVPYMQMQERMYEAYSPFQQSRITEATREIENLKGQPGFEAHANLLDKIAELAGESAYDQAVTRTGSGVNRLRGRGRVDMGEYPYGVKASPGRFSWEEAYLEKYGEDEDIKAFQADQGIWKAKKELGDTVNDSYNELEKANKDIYKDIKEDRYGLMLPGKQESVRALPTSDDSSKTLKVGKGTYESQSYRLIDNLKQQNPEDLHIEWISSEGAKDRKVKKAHEAFAEAPGFNIIGVNEADASGKAFAYVVPLNEEGTPSKDGFKLYFDNPSQKMAIAADYRMKGDMENAIKWADPTISATIESAFDKGVMPEQFTVPIGRDQVTVIQQEDGYYVLDEQGIPVNMPPMRTPEDIKIALYKLYIDNQ